jgi:hypothetical protein
MNALTRIAKAIKGSGCRRLLKQTANEITIDGTGFGIADFKIDIGSISTKIKEFYQVTPVMVAADNNQLLLCEQINQLREDAQLRETCIRIRLQLIVAFNQLQAILGSMNINTSETLMDDLSKWTRSMNTLSEKIIDKLSNDPKSPINTDVISQIMKYQGISEEEMKSAIDELK